MFYFLVLWAFVDMVPLVVRFQKDVSVSLCLEVDQAYPGSEGHATRCLQRTVFQFYQTNDGLRITDLHQGFFGELIRRKH